MEILISKLEFLQRAFVNGLINSVIDEKKYKKVHCLISINEINIVKYIYYYNYFKFILLSMTIS